MTNTPPKKSPRRGTTLIAQRLLAGQREEITMMDLRSRPGDIITQVQMGKIFVITKGGHVVAQITEYEPTALELGGAVRRLGLVKP